MFNVSNHGGECPLTVDRACYKNTHHTPFLEILEHTVMLTIPYLETRLWPLVHRKRHVANDDAVSVIGSRQSQWLALILYWKEQQCMAQQEKS